MTDRMQEATQPVDIKALVHKLAQANLEKARQAIDAPVLRGWFIGQIMKETHGKANPVEVDAYLLKYLNRLGYWHFYSIEPTGWGCQGGYDFLNGRKREFPMEIDEQDDVYAYLHGYDYCQKLFPDKKFTPP